MMHPPSAFVALLAVAILVTSVATTPACASSRGRGKGVRSSSPPSPPPPPPFNPAAEVQQVLAALKAGNGASFAAVFEEANLLSVLVDGINSVIAAAPAAAKPSSVSRQPRQAKPAGSAYLLFVPTDTAFDAWVEPTGDCPTIEEVVRSHIVFLNGTGREFLDDDDADGEDDRNGDGKSGKGRRLRGRNGQREDDREAEDDNDKDGGHNHDDEDDDNDEPGKESKKGKATLEPNTLIARAAPDVESKNVTVVERNKRGRIARLVTKTVYTYFPKVKTVDATTLVDVPSSSARLISGPTRVPATAKYILVQFINAVLSPAVDCGAPAPAPLGG